MPARKKEPSTEVATVEPQKASLLAKMADRASLDPKVFLDTVSKTVFKEAKNQEQVITLLMVADQYGLNPITKEIMAFPDKGGGVTPVVGVDGWNRIAQQHPQFDGVEFRYADEMVKPEGGKVSPEWIECVVYRKDRAHPIVIREYLEECYRKTGPWQSHTKRMLRHKALIQGYRTAFGFHGIYDEDEAERMYVEGTTPQSNGNAARARELLGASTTSEEASKDATDAPVAPDDIAEDVCLYCGEIIAGEHSCGESVATDDDIDIVDEDGQEVLDVKVPPRATEKQVAAVRAAAEKGGWSADGYRRLLSEYDVEQAEDLDGEQALDIVRHLLAGEEEGDGA